MNPVYSNPLLLTLPPAGPDFFIAVMQQIDCSCTNEHPLLVDVFPCCGVGGVWGGVLYFGMMLWGRRLRREFSLCKSNSLQG